MGYERTHFIYNQKVVQHGLLERLHYTITFRPLTSIYKDKDFATDNEALTTTVVDCGDTTTAWRDATAGQCLWHCCMAPLLGVQYKRGINNVGTSNMRSKNSQRVIHGVNNAIFNIFFKSSLKISQCPILHVFMHPKIITNNTIDCPLILVLHLYVTSCILLAATSTYTCTSPQHKLVCSNSPWPTKVVCSLSLSLILLNPWATPTHSNRLMATTFPRLQGVLQVFQCGSSQCHTI